MDFLRSLSEKVDCLHVHGYATDWKQYVSPIMSNGITIFAIRYPFRGFVSESYGSHDHNIMSFIRDQG